MHMKQLLENFRGYLREGQKGTLFEEVVVDVARGVDPGAAGKTEDKTTKLTFEELAVAALAKMGLKPGDDPQAKKHDQQGSITPKTDIILDGKKVSLKLPGDIQFASGEAKSSSAVFRLALEEYLATRPRDLMTEVQREMSDALISSIESFVEGLAQTVGKRYLPSGSDGYISKLKSKAQMDWDAGEWPSGSVVPRALKKKGTPQQVFSEQMDYVKYFIKACMRNAWENDRIAIPSWEKFSEEVMSGLKEKIKNLSSLDRDYYNIIIDEWLTGRRQFANSPGDAAAYLLSPDGFYSIATPQDTAKLASDWEKFIDWDVRGKGRNYLAKAVTVRIGFKAGKYYKALQNAVIHEVETSSPITESAESTPEVEELADLVAQQIPVKLEIESST